MQIGAAGSTSPACGERWSVPVGGASPFRLDELEAVAERIVDEDARIAGQRLVLGDLAAVVSRPYDEALKVAHHEGRVRLAGRLKILLHAEVNLDRAVGEPGTAARGERWRLHLLLELQHVDIEGTRRCFLARRHGDEDVIDADDAHEAPPGWPVGCRAGMMSKVAKCVAAANGQSHVRGPSCRRPVCDRQRSGSRTSARQRMFEDATRMFAMRVLCALMALLLLAATAGAQDVYPNRQITLIAPYAAGGSTDLVARVLSEGLRSKFNQPVTVENKPGGNGVIGTREMVKSPPDGYTLLIGALGAQVLPAVMAPNFPFDPSRDFVPIAGLAEWAGVMLVRKDLPVSSLKDFIAYAKRRP